MSLALGDVYVVLFWVWENLIKNLSEPSSRWKNRKKIKTLNDIMDKDIPIINSNSSIMDAVLIMTEKNMDVL